MSNDLSALTGLQDMRCGGCGGDLFKVFTADRTQRIVVQCQQCMSTSFIEPVPAKLQIKWGEGDGCITVF